MKKRYVKPLINLRKQDPQGLPTVLAVAAIGAALGAAAVGVSKLVGDDILRHQEKSLMPCK